MANKIYVANEQTVQSVKTEVNGIHSKMGNGADASSSSTVFGKLNDIGKNVSTMIEGVLHLAGTIGKDTDDAYKQTLFGKMVGVEEGLSEVKTNTARGVVKSVQRGTVIFDGRNSSNTTVMISSVNPKKSLVLLNNSLAGTINTAVHSGSTTYAYELQGEQSIVTSFSSRNFVLTPCYQVYQSGRNPSTDGSTKGGSVNWQVIEFY